MISAASAGPFFKTRPFGPRGVTFGVNQTPSSGKSTGVGNDYASFLLDQSSQVTTKLTLTAGLRWELSPPPHEPYTRRLLELQPV